MKCCCGETLIGPWWDAFHSPSHCYVWMPTGNPEFITRYDAYPIWIWENDPAPSRKPGPGRPRVPEAGWEEVGK